MEEVTGQGCEVEDLILVSPLVDPVSSVHADAQMRAKEAEEKRYRKKRDQHKSELDRM